MAEKYYDLTITGVNEKNIPEAVIKQLPQLCKTDSHLPEYKIREALFLKRKVEIPYNLPYSEAMQKKELLEKIGLSCSLQPAWALLKKEKDIPKHSCPACGHVQELSENGLDICDQCGVVGAKYGEKKRREDLIALEKSKYQSLQKHAEKEKKAEEDRELREEERKKIKQQLGLDSKYPVKHILTGGSITLGILVMIAFVYFTYNHETSEQELAQTEQKHPPQAAPIIIKSTNKDIVNGLQSANQISSGPSGKIAIQTALDSKAMIEQQEFQQVIDEVSGIEDVEIRAASLSMVAGEYANAGEKKSSEQAFSHAFETLKEAKNEEQRYAILEGIASARIVSGNFPKALNAALKIQNAHRRIKVLFNIAQAQFLKQDKLAAEKTLARMIGTASKLKKVSERAQALSSIARLDAKLGNTESAQENLKRSLSYADQVVNPSVRVNVLCNIAKDQLKIS